MTHLLLNLLAYKGKCQMPEIFLQIIMSLPAQCRRLAIPMLSSEFVMLPRSQDSWFVTVAGIGHKIMQNYLINVFAEFHDTILIIWQDCTFIFLMFWMWLFTFTGRLLLFFFKSLLWMILELYSFFWKIMKSGCFNQSPKHTVFGYLYPWPWKHKGLSGCTYLPHL